MLLDNSGREGNYCLITGASSGIGYELAKLFAQDGYNLVLLSRREDKLKQLASALEKEFKIKTIILPRDLSVAGAAQEIYDLIKKRDVLISGLVNNAGFLVYGEFSRSAWEEEARMLQVNLTALVHLTKLFLPEMIHRGQGMILNVGSIGSFSPGPLNALYCATKSFVLSFSEALGEELKGSGVRVTALCPGGTKTEFAERADIGQTFIHTFGVMSAGQVAAIGYQALMSGKRVCVPGLLNRMIVFLIRFSPRGLVARMSKWMMKRRK
ncbi:MAG: SDR family oxidoreductase [Candidatus Omnitrophota bacterium]